jgi:class 3 adenylate cyclase/tetratricopeptide (TPR) repeat protein
MVTCPSCGQENPAGFRLCGMCGATLQDALPSREERKVVTVFFCDLVGSTAHAERMDPEDVRALLSRYHGRVRRDLERFGGTVEKFIGDAVMALFGAPVAHEDDPERAVRAALAIREWAQEEGGLQVRIGITTGEALVALGANPQAGEGMASGDVVNTAARVQSAAPVNGILVDETTYRATQRAIEYREHAAVAAKGKAMPVSVREALATRARLGVDVDTASRTPLIGRRNELEQLRHALTRAREERVPQLVTLVGVPGIGKSRLVQELGALVDAEPELTAWRQGRSLPYGEGVSFWALGEMVKAQCGILESDKEDDALVKLRGAISELVPAADVGWVETELRLLLGLADQTSASRDRDEAFAAWRRFFEALAEVRPLVLVFEDLHWADKGLLDFVDHLVDWSMDVPLLVLCTARPELLTRRQGWGGGKPNAVTLSLGPLSELETASLVHELLARSVLPAELQTAVLGRAGGNPLYAEEFARMLAERSIEGETDLPVPESVQGVIAARLDSLQPDEKELLQDGAVVGKVFWLGPLANGRPREPIERLLHGLERKEFVRRERRSAVAGEPQYAFRHVLVRDVAYAQIPRAARAQKHEHVASWIESLGRPEDHAELLAHHYVSALEYARASGGDTSELAVRARVVLREAGRRADAVGAPEAARRFYDAAVELWPEDDPEWPELILELGRLRVKLDLQGDALVQRARDALLEQGDRVRAGEAEVLLGELRWLRGERDQAKDSFRQAEQLIAGAPTSRATAYVVGQLARFSMLGDEHARAIELGRRAISEAIAVGDEELRAAGLNNLGCARVSLGDWDGLAELEASVAVARERSPAEYVRACGNLAWAYGGAGRLDEAFRSQDEGLAVAERIGFVEPVRWLNVERVWQLYLTGRWQEASQLVDDLLADFASAPLWIEPMAHIYRARLDLATGEEARAVDRVVGIVERGRAAKDLQLANPCFAFAAYVWTEVGGREAGPVVDELLEAWTAAGYASSVDEWLVDLWAALRRLGRADDLRPALDAQGRSMWRDGVEALLDRDYEGAAAVFAAMGAVPVEAMARLWAAEGFVEQGRGAEADAQLERALGFWRSVGAARYIREAEALLSAPVAERRSVSP